MVLLLRRSSDSTRDRSTSGGMSGCDGLSPRALTRRFEGCGWTTSEAVALTARLRGVPAVADGWTLAELERILFLRWLVETGRLPSLSR